MDPAGPASAQEAFAEGQGQGHGLLRHCPGRGHVLEIAPGGKAGGPHQGQIGVEVPGPQGVPHGQDPAVFVVDMHGPEHRPVPADPAQLRQAGQEVRLRHLGQHGFAEDSAEGLQLSGNGGVLPCQVRVARAAVDDEQGVARRLQVQLQLLHHGGVGVGKAHEGGPAHGAGGLVQPSAGLAEPVVLHPLPQLRQLQRRQSVLLPEDVEDLGQQDLKGGGGGQTAPRQHRGGGPDVQAAGLGPGIALHHALQQRQRALLGGGGIPGRVQADLAGREARGPQPHPVRPVGGDGSHSIHVHGGGQHQTVLVIRVVAPQLRASGGGEKADRLRAAALRRQRVLQRQQPGPVPGGPVNLVKSVFHGNPSFILCLRLHSITICRV